MKMFLKNAHKDQILFATSERIRSCGGRSCCRGSCCRGCGCGPTLFLGLTQEFPGHSLSLSPAALHDHMIFMASDVIELLPENKDFGLNVRINLRLDWYILHPFDCKFKFDTYNYSMFFLLLFCFCFMLPATAAGMISGNVAVNSFVQLNT
jgi:hypothetical protein